MNHPLVSALLNTARKAYHSLPVAPNQRLALQSWFYRHLPWLFAKTPSYQLWQSRQEALQATATPAETWPAPPTADALPDRLQALALPQTDSPLVSIIIPVYGKLEYTAHCLDSLSQLQTAIAFEVIVVDDASPDNTRNALENIPDLRLVTNATNLGFIRSCNRGASLAIGEYLVFLNNDTYVLHGWLDGLLNAFISKETVGLVGSKLIYPDGRLQEAGNIVWRDGTAMNVGRLENPDRTEFNYRREVDYCSGASIMIPQVLFSQLGGFDERYVPAYYEDADLAFAVRQAGYQTLYQPASRLLHYEGISSGTDMASGMKSYQAINRLKFAEKWANELTGHSQPGSSPALARDRGKMGRLLILDETTPTPDQDSGSLDAYWLQKTLVELGYKVVFAPDNLHKLEGYTQKLQQLGVECLYSPFVPTLKRYLQQFGDGIDFVILNRAQSAAANIAVVKRFCPKAKIIFNTVDLQFLRLRREAEVTGSAETADIAKRLETLEMSLMRQAHRTLVISEAEAELLRRREPGLPVTVMPFMREIPGCKHPFEERRDIVFLGGFDHAPNVDAVQYFAESLWPLIRPALPEAKFLIIGSKMTDAVKALSNQAGVVVVGFVEDLSEYFDRCKLTVVPLRFGAGIKGKIGTSASYGVPSVATTIAVEGMGLVNGEQVLIADEPAAFAEAVIRLYRDPTLWDSLSQNCLNRIEEQYSIRKGRERIINLLDSFTD